MRKEDFLYQFLVKFNEYEKSIKGHYVPYWKAQENDGLIFNALRNILCHNVNDFFGNINNYVSLEEILCGLTDLKLDYKKRLKLIQFLLNTANIENKFKEKGFNKTGHLEKNNSYMFFYKNNENIYSTIFFHNNAQFVSCNVTTFDHNNNQKGLIDRKYYLETEYCSDFTLLKIWNYEQDFNLKPYLELIICDKKGLNIFDETIDEISYCVIKNDKYVEYTTNDKSPSDYTKVINKYSIKELASQHFNFGMMERIATQVKTNYKELNEILHKIGIKDASI